MVYYSAFFLRLYMPYKYPFLDLVAINAPYQEAFKLQLQAHLKHAHFISGSAHSQFLQAFSQYCQSPHAIGVNSGLDALTLMLRAYQILGLLPQGSGVLLPSFTFIATAQAILHNALVPQFVDIGKDYLLDPCALEASATPQTKAILVVHLYGQVANMQAIKAIANKHGWLVLEDCAQATGALYAQQRVGSLGHAGAFSFYPSKNLGALGDGGCVLSSNSQLIETIRVLSNNGSPDKKDSLYLGYNSRLDSIQASFLHVKLPHLDTHNAKRRALAQIYLDTINNPYVYLPCVHNIEEHVFHLFVIRISQGLRSQMQKHLASYSIETRIHYPIPIHLQRTFKEYANLSLPYTTRYSQEVLSLPISPTQSIEDTLFIAKAINAFKPI